MNFLDLPNELIINIFERLQDVYLYLRLAAVCKKFQLLVRSMVLIIGDDAVQSKYFKSICSDYVRLSAEFVQDKDVSLIRRHSFFIIELEYCTNTMVGSTSIKTSSIKDAVSKIINNRTSKYHSIIDVFLSGDALSALLSINDQDYLKRSACSFEISRTICLLGNDGGYDTEFLSQYQLELTGHTFDFYNIKELPKIYLTVNPKFDFKINSKSIKVLNNIANVTMKTPRLPPLLKFLEESNLPNLTTLNHISIEAGLSLKIFQKFEKLKNLSLESAFTGNLELQISPSEEITTLQNLKNLEVTGNAISLSSLSLPNLHSFKIELHGSLSRTFSQNLFFENIYCPRIRSLDIHVGSLSGGLAYVTNELKYVVKDVKKLGLSSHSSSFPQTFEQLKFDNVKELVLAHSGFEMIESEHLFSDTSSVNEDEIVKIDPENLIFPKLEMLMLSRSAFKLIGSFINDQVSYPSLKHLVLAFRVEESPQEFVFDKVSFPKLENAWLYCANRYGPLKKCDITLKLKELPNIREIKTDSSLNIEVDEGDPYGLMSKIKPIDLLN